MTRVVVVIANWNGQALLSACLTALAAQVERDMQVIVVDNGSTDGSCEYLAAHFPAVQVIANRENRGFAAATNQGIRASASEYVATLNNDVLVDPLWLASLLEVAARDARVGMCASKLLFADRPHIINSAGICIDRAGIAWDCRGGELDVPDEVESSAIFGPCAGAALYRRAMLDEIGLFDEDFFAYMEDVDLAWRAQRAGWSCRYVPQARALHHHSATGKEGSPFKSFHLGRNKVWLLLKNYPVRARWYDAPLVVLYDVLAVTYALLARRDIHALRGRLAGLRAARQMWCKRRPGMAAAEYFAPFMWPWQVMARYRHIRKGKTEA